MKCLNFQPHLLCYSLGSLATLRKDMQNWTHRIHFRYLDGIAKRSNFTRECHIFCGYRIRSFANQTRRHCKMSRLSWLLPNKRIEDRNSAQCAIIRILLLLSKILKTIDSYSTIGYLRSKNLRKMALKKG